MRDGDGDVEKPCVCGVKGKLYVVVCMCASRRLHVLQEHVEDKMKTAFVDNFFSCLFLLLLFRVPFCTHCLFLLSVGVLFMLCLSTK